MEPIRVVSGNPTPEELAATVAVLTSAQAQRAAAAAAEAENGRARRTPAWSNPGLRLQVPRSWRDSALPMRIRVGK
ncbi:acyl-CoA carboxylase subunit epsilon [Natronoglycomyces albus]|uniref:Acyl-CoA carboxylase subunit epsilon n=1 Tax=Natronoglycomyces albus TaxID=2811108 RepID=A0A895XRG0_9ACTN|nr:acyl-CoA carboxylase subunit epsilon [Natronoglycomyces albus]QSB05929.1 acyl-CoA carboxylase subunit epsilon [Natronoglycomyces albus]